MKILLLNLSDAHFTDKTYIKEDIIDAQVQALNALGDFDQCIVLFAGDIAFSGKENEYKKAQFYLGKLYQKIKDKFNINISTFVVPGNHDINFGSVTRNRNEIRDLLNNTICDETISNELNRFEKFFKFASYYKCFMHNKLVENKFLTFGKEILQINLINSELFSTYNDENKDDDKGLHYLPESEINKLKKRKDSNFVITLSHRGPDWFIWESGNNLKKMLYANTDIFVYGHEHINDITNTIRKDNSLIKSIATGMNFELNNISFTAIMLDTEKKRAQATLLNWKDDNDMFLREVYGEFDIELNKSDQYFLEPNSNFIQDFSLDDEKFNIDQYFVFSGVEKIEEDKYTEINDYNEFLSSVFYNDCTIIEGEDSSGKTLLLKKIYLSIVTKAAPLYLCEEYITKGSIAKAVKFAFDQQYSSKQIDYEKFLQLDKDKRIVLLDDYHKINPKYISLIEEYLNEHFGHIVISTKMKWEIDIVSSIKEKLNKKFEINKYRILPFYSQKRLELIEKLYGLYNRSQGSNVSLYDESKKINDFIREQIRLFSLSPQFINMYVNYCTRTADLEGSPNNAFGKVFENNLVNSIRKHTSDANIDEYSVLLELIAYDIHFQEKYPISSDELSKIIIRYNQENLMNVNFRLFCDVMIKAKVLKEENNSYTFYCNSYLAYFVAKSVNTKYNNGDANGELNIIIQNICFNINGDILLFLSYITSNISMLRLIRENAENLMDNWVEFDIDKKNIGFISNSICPLEIELPTPEDRKKLEQRMEKYEKEAISDEQIQSVSIYDYDKSDVEREDYKLGQALRYTELLCKILPGFNHRLNKNDKEKFVENIFKFPNRILYKIFRVYDLNHEKIVENIMNFCEENDIEITENEIKHDIAKSAETFTLNVYNNFAHLSVTSKTIEAIKQYLPTNTNEKILRIMMLENLGAFNDFTSEAGKLYDKPKQQEVIKSMVSRIVHKHFICNKNLKIIGNVESVATKYFGRSFKKRYLINKTLC